MAKKCRQCESSTVNYSSCASHSTTRQHTAPRCCTAHESCTNALTRADECHTFNKKNDYSIQVFKYVKFKGQIFRTDSSFRGEQRFDCVKLLKPCTRAGNSFKYARLMWLIGSNDFLPLCLATPLFETKQLPQDTHAQMSATAFFVPVKRTTSLLACFPVSDIDRIEQVQFMATFDCLIGLLNPFAKSSTQETLLGEDDDT